MKLSLADKLALIYTSAGSLSALAGLVGVSRSVIKRELEAGTPRNRRADFAEYFARSVEVAFAIHKDLAREQARADNLPFDPALPVFYERLKFKDGTPGDRVGALHTHYLPDALRNEWLIRTSQTGKFYAASVQSIVNLIVYNKRAEETTKRRDMKRQRDRATIQNKIYQNVVTGPIYTPYTMLKASAHGREVIIPPDWLTQDLNNKLRSKHEPATGEPGTALASGVLLQIDTRSGRDAKFRNAHPFEAGAPAKRPGAKSRKARGTSKRRR